MSQLQLIAAAAAEEGLLFLLAGGHAVIAHGYRRATFDTDLIIRHSDQAKWIELARRLGYESVAEGPTFLQFSAKSEQQGALDLMLVNNETFAKLFAQSVPGPPEQPGVKLVSLPHLLALKCHAIKYGHSGRLGKDLEDVLELVRANAVDVSAPEIKSLFLKYGTEELYERVRRIKQRP